MENPGGVTMSEEAFGMVKAAEIQSMAWTGFTRIFVMRDHGGGQNVMKKVAQEMNGRLVSKGVRVFYVADFYFKYQEDVRAYCTAHKLPIGAHGGVMETSRLLYLEPAPDMYVRAIFKTLPFDSRLDGDPRPSSKAIGRDLQAIGIGDTVAQIRRLMNN
jgi:creatinine amidohydrolase